MSIKKCMVMGCDNLCKCEYKGYNVCNEHDFIIEEQIKMDKVLENFKGVKK